MEERFDMLDKSESVVQSESRNVLSIVHSVFRCIHNIRFRIIDYFFGPIYY